MGVVVCEFAILFQLGVEVRQNFLVYKLSVNQFYVEMKLFLYPLEFCCFAKFDNSKSLSLMFAWQIPFTFPALLFCLHYWVMLTVINNKYSTLRLDIEGCWNEVAPFSCWTNFVLYDLCVLLYCVNVNTNLIILNTTLNHNPSRLSGPCRCK